MPCQREAEFSSKDGTQTSTEAFASAHRGFRPGRSPACDSRYRDRKDKRRTQRLFELFTTKKSGKGSGLGLAHWSTSIVEQHAGPSWCSRSSAREALSRCTCPVPHVTVRGRAFASPPRCGASRFLNAEGETHFGPGRDEMVRGLCAAQSCLPSTAGYQVIEADGASAVASSRQSPESHRSVPHRRDSCRDMNGKEVFEGWRPWQGPEGPLACRAVCRGRHRPPAGSSTRRCSSSRSLPR